ncbi:MAG: HAMP domain-containing histidine kinase [Treponema sp.]|jgi:signal transduction histidine kinase|nr:HAMP domain-containing histidine kinase [Treponema sp.]
MKIKTQFHLLIAGLFLVPILSFTGQGLFLLQRDEGPRLPVYEEIAPLLNDSVDPKGWRQLAAFLRRLRPNTEITIFRADLTVIFSSTDEFTQGEIASGDKIFSLIGSEDSRYSYTFESLRWFEHGEEGVWRLYVLQHIDRESERVASNNPMLIMARVMMTGIGLAMLFAIVMAFIVARSITQSVSGLEKATRRIAAGELDLNVDVKGSNEITSLNASLNHMRLALKENNQRRARFIMGITHDLKTPLALIKGYTEAIEDGIADDPESQKRSLGIIVSKVDQLEGMIDDLLNFVRLDSGEWRGKLKPVNLAAFLSAYAKRVVDDAELLRRTVESHINLPNDLCVPLDERLALRALENLVNNAIRYTRTNGHIALNAWVEVAPNRRVIIEVRDNGPGIAEADLPHVFETFYRGTNSRREQGMGLGLAVVKGVADSHGWKLDIQNSISGGSVFRITIDIDKEI